MRVFRDRAGWIAAIVTAAAMVSAASQARAQGGLGGLDDLKSDILADLKQDAGTQDLAGIRDSHLTLVETWDQVEPLLPRNKVAGSEYRWRALAEGVRPLGTKPISTLIHIPRDGEYRVYLRHWIGVKHASPVELTLEPVALPSGADANAAKAADFAANGPALRQNFGEARLISGVLGKEQEAKLPLKLESEVQLNTYPDEAMFAWEYRDVKLKAGPHRLSLASSSAEARVHAVFISASKSFRPSFAPSKKDNTLEGVFVRYRLKSGSAGPQYSLALNVTYHWRGRKAPGSTEPLWYDSVGMLSRIPAKEWSPFIDVREQVLPGGGPWSTCRTSFTGVDGGRVEVQFAWHPHEAAVLQSFETAVSERRAMFRLPHGRYHHGVPVTAPAWGVWSPQQIAGLVPEEAIVEKYFAWAEDAARTLGLPADHPKPKHLHVLSSCRTGAAQRPRAAEMLAKLGVNWIPDAPAEVAAKFELYDDATAKKVKLGDEIATHVPAASINDDAAQRAGFQAFLQQQAALNGMDVREFLGVDDITRVECIDELPPNAGRYERRLFYCSQRYCHVAIVDHYARLLRGVEKSVPQAQVYNNYSPHPVFLTGRDMNQSDWFLLPRAGAQTLGWAEDWATGGGWGLGTPATECTTFYAALVECAVRKHGYPSGFYVGANCGYSAQKMFSCVSQGISILHLYDWGPIDAWAEGSNAWSELESQYLSVMQGTHALGPVDEIVARGTREPRRTALLYNRTHEIVSGRRVWLNRDWMWTFLALRNSQIPVDVIIEEDLNEKDLARYDVLFVGGMNLERRHLQALAGWVERGGRLIASAGFAERDAFDDPLPETATLFGAEQHPASTETGAGHDRIQFVDEKLFPTIELQSAAAGDRKYVLKPTTGRVAAKYDGGEPACVVAEHGRGSTVLLGVTTGEMYRIAGGAAGPARAWLAAPVLEKLGRRRAEYDCPLSEVTVFDHPTGTAVLIAHYAGKDDVLPQRPGKLSVAVDRPVKEVRSALRGPLSWKMIDGRAEIELPPAAEIVVDSVLIR